MKRSLILTLLCTVATPFAWGSEADKPGDTTAPITPNVAPFPCITAEDWKVYQFGSTKLGVQTHAPADETLQPFYDRMSKALLRAALSPNAAIDKATPELDELIRNMQASSKDFSDSQTCAVLKNAAVTSLGDTRALLQNLITQYEEMKETVTPHLVWTSEAARALHEAITHEQEKINKCKATLTTKQPEMVVRQANAFITQAETDVSRLKNMLLCVIGVGHAMYPNVHTEASTMSTIVSTFSWLASVASNSAASPEVTLKSVVGVDQVPAQLELVMPDPTKDRAYHEFLQRMLGHASWVKDQAFEEGRLKWVIEPQAVIAQVAQEEDGAAVVTKAPPTTPEISYTPSTSSKESKEETPPVLLISESERVKGVVVTPTEGSQPSQTVTATSSNELPYNAGNSGRRKRRN